MALHYDGEVRIVKVNMGRFMNNGYIVSCPETNEGILIDTPEEAELLLNEVGDVNIKAILITHNHQDHLLGFDDITGSVDAPVGITTADKGPLPRAPEMELSDGQVIPFGNRELKVLVTPGHTDGASCFLVGNHLFSGDTLFPGGPGKSRSPEALKTILDSISSKLLTLPEDTQVYPGHGDDTTIAEAKRRHAVYTSKSHPADQFGDIDWLGS